MCHPQKRPQNNSKDPIMYNQIKEGTTIKKNNGEKY